jgi:hypothetical protein
VKYVFFFVVEVNKGFLLQMLDVFIFGINYPQVQSKVGFCRHGIHLAELTGAQF